MAVLVFRIGRSYREDKTEERFVLGTLKSNELGTFDRVERQVTTN